MSSDSPSFFCRWYGSSRCDEWLLIRHTNAARPTKITLIRDVANHVLPAHFAADTLTGRNIGLFGIVYRFDARST
jgi:hypothetical protein